jgi:putative ABC transport system permease protein
MRWELLTGFTLKFIPLVWSGIWRRPARSVLIFLQVSVAFALFGLLQGLKTGVDELIAQTRADVLVVHGSLALFDPLPLSLLEQIRAIPGVKVAIPVELSGAVYQNPTQKLGIVAVRPDEGWLSAFTFTLSPGSEAAFHRLRTAAIVRDGVARKYGWKTGDHIPLQLETPRQDGSTTWTFDVVGTYADSDLNGGSDNVLINYDYFDEARVADRGMVKHYKVEVTEPSLAVAVTDQIDHRFANSGNETTTESMRALAQAQLQSIGDLNFLIRSVVGAVLVALLFSTATMMMQSTRERMPELGVLKTIGFSDAAIFVCILAEALTIFLAAAACGLGLAVFAFPLAAHIVPGLSMPPIVVASGLACAVVAAAISAAVPAAHAARSNIVAALAGR